ncbi:hypothetical protein VTJ49DRAFT_2612 [Mycothermus thermophilus]|uniref:Sialidase domain-containing protein n=1 Tax=Humicola insolens TaxID=85995 RepID=A0ABR3V9R2_HUMIN
MQNQPGNLLVIDDDLPFHDDIDSEGRTIGLQCTRVYQLPSGALLAAFSSHDGRHARITVKSSFDTGKHFGEPSLVVVSDQTISPKFSMIVLPKSPDAEHRNVSNEDADGTVIVAYLEAMAGGHFLSRRTDVVQIIQSDDGGRTWPRHDKLQLTGSASVLFSPILYVPPGRDEIQL